MDRTNRDLHPRTAGRIDADAPRRTGTPGTGRVTLLSTRTTIGEVDLVAVERAVNGEIDPTGLTRAERQAAARVLLLRGHGPTVAEARTGLRGLKAGDPDSTKTATGARRVRRAAA